jgi:hypothetical protein
MKKGSQLTVSRHEEVWYFNISFNMFKIDKQKQIKRERLLVRPKSNCEWNGMYAYSYAFEKSRITSLFNG